MSRPLEEAITNDPEIFEIIKANAEALEEEEEIKTILILKENGIDPSFPTWGTEKENGDANDR